jgi:hypothetical protein
LKARAQKNRWAEELALTKNEMEWVTRFFFSKRRQWRIWLAGVGAPSMGQMAYAERQMAMWQEMAVHGYQQFNRTYPDLGLLLTDIASEYEQ